MCRKTYNLNRCYTNSMKKIVLILVIFLSFFLIPRHAQAQIYTTDKLITVDTGKQRLYAWEGGQIQKEFPVSTGMRYTPTVKGNFKIWLKNEKQNMKGSYPPYEPYFLKDVPYVMFFKGDYAIHGTYWHNKFGSRASHGCVNMRVDDAKWVYDWAPKGTQVMVF